MAWVTSWVAPGAGRPGPMSRNCRRPRGSAATESSTPARVGWEDKRCRLLNTGPGADPVLSLAAKVKAMRGKGIWPFMRD